VSRHISRQKGSRNNSLHATIEYRWKQGFLWSVPRGYKEDNWSKNIAVGREPPFREDMSLEAKE
jgi:hypothetical protein